MLQPDTQKAAAARRRWELGMVSKATQMEDLPLAPSCILSRKFVLFECKKQDAQEKF